jgi:hypothetical protein
MFEKATKMKLRFDSPLGRLTTEDLWDLPLLAPKKGAANLDDLAKGFARELRDNNVESFVLKRESPSEEVQLKFEIVKHIIKVRLAEQEAAENIVKARRKKDQILAIIAEKETEDLKGKGVDELRALLDEL